MLIVIYIDFKMTFEVKISIVKVPISGFIIAIDYKTVNFLQIMSIFVQNALRKGGRNLKILCLPPDSCPMWQIFEGVGQQGI